MLAVSLAGAFARAFNGRGRRDSTKVRGEPWKDSSSQKAALLAVARGNRSY